MAYWLMKSEPDGFSIDDLARIGTDGWDGVRNYQARNFMREMAVGDEAFFYHSSCAEGGIVGQMRIVSAAYPDPTQFDPESKYFDPRATIDQPRWFHVDVAFVCKWQSVLSLKTIKSLPDMDDFLLVKKGSRLSVMPVAEKHWNAMLAVADIAD